MVISCGNLVAGGTGKTPLTKWLAEHCQALNFNPAIITRGYKRIGSKPLVLNAKSASLPWYLYGDEPYYLYQTNPALSVYIDPNRRRAINHAGLKHDLVILDDGFSQDHLVKHLDLVLFDATHHLDKLKLLPQGRLREPLKALNRSHAILINRVNLNPKNSRLIKAKLRQVTKKVPIFEISYLPCYLLDQHNKKHSLNLIKNQRVSAICAIGSPESFRQTITNLGARLNNFIVFPDHHRYQAKDLSKINPSDIWLTTEKDGVRIKQFNHLFPQIYRLVMELNIGEELKQFIDKRLKRQKQVKA